MNYYIGTIVINDHDSGRESSKQYPIAANGMAQARKLLDDEAADWGGDDCRKIASGEYAYNENEGQGYVVSVGSITKITPAAFTELRKQSGCLGKPEVGDLAVQEPSEQVKTLARRLTDQIVEAGGKLQYAILLQALSASLGHTDWQSLKGKHPSLPHDDSTEENKPYPGFSNLNSVIDGEGSLYSVPVFTDSRAMATVLVRAQDADEAGEVARHFAGIEGNVQFDVMEGSYRGLADVFLSEEADDGIAIVDEATVAQR